MAIKLLNILCVSFLIILLACRENTNAENIPEIEKNMEGGDHKYEEQGVTNFPIQLRTKDNRFYFLNSNTDDYTDTIYLSLESLKEKREGTYALWFMDIDKGSIGPFNKLMDTGITYLNKNLTDTVYSFRLDKV